MDNFWTIFGQFWTILDNFGQFLDNFLGQKSQIEA